MLLDPVTWMPASRSEEVLTALDPEVAEHTAAETHGSAVELATDPHETVADGGTSALRPARRPRRRAARARPGRRRGRHASARALGGHARSRPARATSSSTPRCASWRGASRRSRCTSTSRCRTRDAAIRALNGVRAHLPVLLAASANSPFWQGRDSGLASARTPVFQAFPRTGPPRHFATYAEYVEAIDVLLRCDAFPEPTFLWWDVRLQPALGTIEVRVMDAQTRVTDTAALAALVQCLVRREALEGDEAAAPMAPEVLEENRFLAARDGMRASLVDPRRPLRAVADVLDGARALLRPARAVAALRARARPTSPSSRGGPARPASARWPRGPRGCPGCCADSTATSSRPARSRPPRCGPERRCAGSRPSCAPAARRSGRAGAHGRGAGPARARRRRAVAGRRRRARAPPTGDHRPLGAGAQPMRDAALGLRVVFNGCIYNHRELRRGARGRGHAFASSSDTEVLLKGWAEWGEGMLDRLRACSPSAWSRSARGGCAGPRPPRGQAAVPDRPARRRPARGLLAARAAARRRGRHARGPGRAAPLPVVALDRARPAHDPARRRQAPARDRAGGRARRQPPRAPLLGSAVRPRPRARRLGRGRLDGGGPRGAARRGHAPHGRRRAGRRAAVGRAGLEPDRRAAGRGGPARAGHVLDRLPRRGRARGQRVPLLGPDGARVRDRRTAGSRRPRTTCSPRCRTRSRR